MSFSGIVTMTSSLSRAASATDTAVAPVSAARAARLWGPREFATATVCPSARSRRVSVPPMLPAPMIPMFMLAPYAEVSEQHITRVARRRRDALLGELRVLAWARPAAGDARAQARGHRGVPSLRWVTRSLDHPTPTAHDVVRAVVRGTRRQLGIALAEVVAARAPPALR